MGDVGPVIEQLRIDILQTPHVIRVDDDYRMYYG